MPRNVCGHRASREHSGIVGHRVALALANQRIGSMSVGRVCTRNRNSSNQ
jgi:hypothetical protein